MRESREEAACFGIGILAYLPTCVVFAALVSALGLPSVIAQFSWLPGLAALAVGHQLWFRRQMRRKYGR